MNHEEALHKVRKLMRLSESPNSHEAALAAARAQEIIERYKIESIALEYDDSKPTRPPDEPIKDFFFDPLEKTGATWKVRLALGLAKENQCMVYSRIGRLNLIGRPSDVATIRYLYAWLSREIERLAARDCTGCGRTYWNNYRLGAVAEIRDRLSAQRAATRTAMKAETVSAHALAVIESAIANLDQCAEEVEEWVRANMRMGSSGPCSYRFDSGAHAAGRATGASINLRPSAGSITGGYQLP